MTLTSAIPVLRAGDYPRARAFWTHTLGFTVAEEGGDPPWFGIFKRDGQTVFVDAWHGPDPEEAPLWRAYFHTTSLDALARDLTAKGVAHNGPVDTVYGMREVTLRDPDGNLICFGQDG